MRCDTTQQSQREHTKECHEKPANHFPHKNQKEYLLDLLGYPRR